MNVTLRPLKNDNDDFKQLHRWCKNKFVYEWFEQRILSYDEIVKKDRNKLFKKKQKLFIIQYNNKDIGLVQIYKFENDINIDELNHFNNIYEYDLFIGEEEYLSKGIGTSIVQLINQIIYYDYLADAIILRPFKRNVRAIKCYEKCDFKLIKDYAGKDTLGNHETIEVLLNTKKLTN